MKVTPVPNSRPARIIETHYPKTADGSGRPQIGPNFSAWYNLCQKHKSLVQTPAMAANLTDHVWTIKEMIERATELDSASCESRGRSHVVW
jgi:hypothetical protein